jgi:hypothetical protein
MLTVHRIASGSVYAASSHSTEGCKSQQFLRPGDSPDVINGCFSGETVTGEITGQ